MHQRIDLTTSVGPADIGNHLLPYNLTLFAVHFYCYEWHSKIAWGDKIANESLNIAVVSIANVTGVCLKLELQKALLSVGEFQSAVDQLMLWINQTLSSLDPPPPVYGDPRTIDAELSRLKVRISATLLNQCASVFGPCEPCVLYDVHKLKFSYIPMSEVVVA